MHKKLLAAVALSALALSACSSRPVVEEAPPPSPTYPDPAPAPAASLHDRVHAALTSQMGAAASGITVRIEGTMVHLSGHVGSQADHERAHQIAHDVPGVTMVHHDELVVH